MCKITWHSWDGAPREGISLLEGSQVWKFTAKWKVTAKATPEDLGRAHLMDHRELWAPHPLWIPRLPGHLYPTLQCDHRVRPFICAWHLATASDERKRRLKEESHSIPHSQPQDENKFFTPCVNIYSSPGAHTD